MKKKYKKKIDHHGALWCDDPHDTKKYGDICKGWRPSQRC